MKKSIMLLALLLAVTVSARAQAPAGFSVLAVGLTTLTYTDSTCANQTICYYVVVALDGSGFSSAPATCNPNAPCYGGNQAIAAIPATGVWVVTVTWNASPTAGVTYIVYRRVGPTAANNVGAAVHQ